MLFDIMHPEVITLRVGVGDVLVADTLYPVQGCTIP